MSAKKYLSLQELWDKKKILRSYISHLDYSHLPKEITQPRQILWHLINDIDEIPKCQHESCDNNVKWGSRRYGYFCSSKCSYSSTQPREKYKQTCLKKYGVQHPHQLDEVKEKTKKTCLEKYGVEHPSQSDEIKKKTKETCLEKYGVEYPRQLDEEKEKYKQTCLAKYGVEHPRQLDEVKEKAEQTCLAKYGVKHPRQLDEIKEKAKRTCIEKYGNEYPTQSDEIKKKTKETCLEKYGVEHPHHLDEIKERAKQTCLEKYGVEGSSQRHFSELTRDIIFDKNKFQDFINGKTIDNIAYELNISTDTVTKYIKKYQLNTNENCRSTLEFKMKLFLDQLDIEYVQNDRIQIKPLELDFYIPSHNLAIEMNGYYWHSDEFLLETRGMTANDYHQMKTDLCNNQGITLIHIPEAEWYADQGKFQDYIIELINATPPRESRDQE